jgi:prepilin-type N-terminal cleavage/methylation domain-containing protein
MKIFVFNYNYCKNLILLKKNNYLRGFTLLEVMVAISMIIMGLTGVISLSIQNIQVRQTNRNILIAAQLAQEGMELIRNKRDSNWIASQAFNADITGDFSLDYTGTKRDTPSGSTDASAKLYLDADNFYVNGVSATTTPFYRFFTVIDNFNYLDVKCVVGWQERGSPKNYSVKTLFYDWK